MAEKTVFILGAGASYEFGLPVGETLKESISNLLGYYYNDNGNLVGGDSTIVEALRSLSRKNADASSSVYVNAARRISNALPLALSIDNFLHNHNNDEQVKSCGKLGVVRSILQAERNSKLYTRNGGPMLFAKCSDTWAVRLVRLITEQCTLDGLRARLGTMAFIIFNYDRCLEHFLAHAIAVSYGIPLEQASEIVDGLEIYHPYGTVGNLPWMTRRKAEVIEYGGEPDVMKLIGLAKEIKTFTEGTAIHDSDILAIRACVKDARRLVFLGYAYHPLNMALLLGDLVRGNTTRRVFGTAFGMSASDTELVRNSLDNALFAPSAQVRNDVTCFNLFHEYSRSLSFV